MESLLSTSLFSIFPFAAGATFASTRRVVSPRTTPTTFTKALASGTTTTSKTRQRDNSLDQIGDRRTHSEV